MVLQRVNFFLSPMQYLPLLAGGGLSHSLSACFKPPPQVLLQLLMGPHLPQPPCTAAGRVPMGTHFLWMHHWKTQFLLFFRSFRRGTPFAQDIFTKNFAKWNVADINSRMASDFTEWLLDPNGSTVKYVAFNVYFTFEIYIVTCAWNIH